jgi:hypothetical protein
MRSLTILLLTLSLSRPAAAQRLRLAPTLRFLGGGAVGLVAHESNHLLANAAFGTPVAFRRVEFHGIPFFAITHRNTVTPREEYVIASAGFWMQHATSEWILTSHPTLRRESHAFAKGVLAFNVLTSVGYAGSAFAKTGPAERDTRSIAASLDVAEPVIGAAILAPALLDGWRYYHPGHASATWASRGLKVGLVLLTLRTRSD